MSNDSGEVARIISEVVNLARAENKATGFCIGNTRKIHDAGLYFSPLRNTSHIVAGSVIVYSVDQAVNIAREVDGRVDYVLVDTEKKISRELYGDGNIGNVERAVRETIKFSKILTYKGNDLTVDSIEHLIASVLSTYPRGLSGKRAAIIGAGNVGSKLALKLVERGMDVAIRRRDSSKLAAIVSALNLIKPAETIAEVFAPEDNIEAARGAHVLIGLTHGIPAICTRMVELLDPDAIIIDGGKGCCEQDAIDLARANGVPIYRADVRPGFEGYVALILETLRTVDFVMGRGEISGVPVVSGGLLAALNEVVVDNINSPRIVYGLADGRGDFIRTLTDEQLAIVQHVRSHIQEARSR